MPDIYDDPDVNDTGFPPDVKFEVVGDRVRGVLLGDPTKFAGRKRQDGTQNYALKYRIGKAAMSQAGKQSHHDEVGLLAGSKNLKGQLITLKPRSGDTLDIELIETRPSGYGSDTKIYRIQHEPAIPGTVVGQSPTAPPSPAQTSIFDNGTPASSLPGRAWDNGPAPEPPPAPVPAAPPPRAAGDDEDDIFAN